MAAAISVFVDSMMLLQAEEALKEIARDERKGTLPKEEAERIRLKLIDSFDDAITFITMQDFPQSKGMPPPLEILSVSIE